MVTTKKKIRSRSKPTKFAKLLKEKELNCNVLAARAKIGRATMWRYRIGKVKPRRAQLIQLADALAMSPKTLAPIMGTTFVAD